MVEINFMREELYHVRDAYLLVSESLVTDRSRGAEIAAHAVSRSRLAHDGLWPLRHGAEELHDMCQPPAAHSLHAYRRYCHASRPSASEDHDDEAAAVPHGCSCHCRSWRPLHSVS